MTEFQLLTEEEIRENLLSRVIARTNLTDVNDSSLVGRIVAAVASELAEGYYGLTRLREMFGMRAQGPDLDDRIRDFPGQLEPRRGARFSVGYCTFERATATASAAVIPVGTIVGAAGSNATYVTLQEAVIAASATSSNAVITRASQSGADFDCGVGTIDTFVGAAPAGVTSVTNSSAMIGGRTTESDDDLRFRMLAYTAALGRSSLRAIRSAIIGLEDPDSFKSIQYAAALADPEEPARAYIYIDDGAGTIETTEVVTGESLIATALGGEQFMRTAARPIKVEAGVTITVTRAGPTTLLPVQDMDFLVNPATGLIYFTDATYIEAGDAVEIDYTTYTGLVRLAQQIISGDPDDTITFPGLEAAGTVTRVLPVIIDDIEISGTVYLASTAPDGCITRALARAIDYVNSIQPSEDGATSYVVRSEIIGAIMQEPGIFDLDLVTPAANTPIPFGHLSRATAGTSSLTEAGV